MKVPVNHPPYEDGLYRVTLSYACGGVIVETKRIHNLPGMTGWDICPRIVDGAPIFGWAWSKDAPAIVFHDWVLRKGGRMERVLR